MLKINNLPFDFEYLKFALKNFVRLEFMTLINQSNYWLIKPYDEIANEFETKAIICASIKYIMPVAKILKD